MLQIARSYVPGGLAGWIIWPKPEPLADLENTVEVDERIASDGSVVRELDEEITKAGMRGKVAPDRPARRHRSTRRRQDAPDLPRRKVSPRTVGKTYTAPDGKVFRPSMFISCAKRMRRFRICSTR